MKILALLLALSIIPTWAEDWTVSGKTYRNVVIGQVEADRVHISYDGGIGTVRLSDLSPDLQKKFNYSSAKADEVISQREEVSRPDWEKVSSPVLSEWVDKIKQQTVAAITPLQASTARVQQMKLVMFDSLLKAGGLAKSSDGTIKQWIDCVMQNQICIGMPKGLVLVAWGDPESDTTNDSAVGTSEIMDYRASTVFLSDGSVQSVSHTQASND